LSSPSRAWERG